MGSTKQEALTSACNISRSQDIKGSVGMVDAAAGRSSTLRTRSGSRSEVLVAFSLTSSLPKPRNLNFTTTPRNIGAYVSVPKRRVDRPVGI
jgi:hypothetical protein